MSVLPLTASTTARDTGDSQARGSSLGQIQATDVLVYRRSGKGGEVYRATVEVDCGHDVSVDTFRGCLATPETRPMCESSLQARPDFAHQIQGIVWSSRLRPWTCWMRIRE